jgi:hypothetical protein
VYKDFKDAVNVKTSDAGIFLMLKDKENFLQWLFYESDKN